MFWNFIKPFKWYFLVLTPIFVIPGSSFTAAKSWTPNKTSTMGFVSFWQLAGGTFQFLSIFDALAKKLV
jgi:hypothetical protein